MRLVITLVLFSLALASAMFGQDRMTAEQFYKNCGQECERPEAAKNGRGLSVVPLNFALLRSSVGEFAQPGEEVRLFLDLAPGRIPEGSVDVYGRRRHFNLDGSLMSEAWFSVEGGLFGHFEKLPTLPAIPVYTGRVSPEQQQGHSVLFDVVIARSPGGQILQQIFCRYYVVTAGYRGRTPYHLDSAKVVESGNTQTVVLEGVFPDDSTMVAFGQPNFFYAFIPAVLKVQAGNGTLSRIYFPFPLGNPTAAAYDIVVNFGGLKETFTLRRGIIGNGSSSSVFP
ncbi:MAG: hypothetical protein JNN11_00115 [Candidatus Doudnabacteria bacterium]|nr:hypothetical protein [Candidatus Doudnabacteria bacterium]